MTVYSVDDQVACSYVRLGDSVCVFSEYHVRNKLRNVSPVRRIIVVWISHLLVLISFFMHVHAEYSVILHRMLLKVAVVKFAIVLLTCAK